MPTGDSTAKVVGNNLVLANGQIQGMADGSAATHGATVGQTAPAVHATQHKSGGTDAIKLNELAVPTAAVVLNSQKITGLASGTTSGDAVHFGQTVTTSVNGLALATDKALHDSIFANMIRSAVLETDDFVCGGDAGTGAAVIPDAHTFGRLQWRAHPTGAAGTAVTIVTTNQDSTHFGVVELNTGTTTAGAAGMGRFATGVLTTTLGSGQIFTQEWLVRIPTVSDGTNTFTFRCGWKTGIASTPTDGVYFEYSSDAPSSGNWIGRTTASSTSTTASGGSTIALSAGAWTRLTITWDGTTMTFLVGGVSIGTSTTNIPTVALAESIDVIKSAGTLARTALVDYFAQLLQWSPTRAA